MSDQLPLGISLPVSEPSSPVPVNDALDISALLGHLPDGSHRQTDPDDPPDLPEPKKKSNAGRKLKFQTDAELRTAIAKYFDEEKVAGYAPTMSGLAVNIGIDRASIMNYSRRAQFFDTIKWARDVVEAATEKLLQKSGLANGMIFSLVNNFSESGWKQKSDQNLNLGSQRDNPLSINIKFIPAKPEPKPGTKF